MKRSRALFCAVLASTSLLAFSACAPIEPDTAPRSEDRTLAPTPDSDGAPGSEASTPAPTPAAAATASIAVSWNANDEPDLSGYRVYYGTAPGNYRSSKEAGRNTKFTIADLVAGQTYYIAVTSYDSAGNESAYSSEVSGSAR